MSKYCKEVNIKNIKLIAVIVVCVVAMFIIDSVINVVSCNLTTTIRHILPWGYTAIVCLKLITIVSISVVAFSSGVVFCVDPKLIYLATITYIVTDWFIFMVWQVFAFSQNQECHSLFTILILSISDAIMLVIAPALSRWICFLGRKLRDK